jgi:shikimate kinase
LSEHRLTPPLKIQINSIPLTDSDEEIEKLDGKGRSCREIFQSDGEEYFRKLEAQVLQNIALSPAKKAVALGGGALSNKFLSAEIKEKLGFIIWLDVDDKTAFERIKAGGLPPFLATEADPLAAFAAMNRARREVFAANADAAVTPEATPRRTALHILSLYKDQLLH